MKQSEDIALKKRASTLFKAALRSFSILQLFKCFKIFFFNSLMRKVDDGALPPTQRPRLAWSVFSLEPSAVMKVQRPVSQLAASKRCCCLRREVLCRAAKSFMVLYQVRAAILLHHPAGSQ